MRLKLKYSLCLFTIAIISTATFLQAQPTIKGTDLVCNGESFFQASNICSELSRLARADGVLAQGDNFKQIAVSGAPIANILNFYKNCNPKPTYLVSDGAGIDLMNSSNISALSNTLKQYLDEMKKGGTKKLLWMIYPDPQGGQWATLKKNQDLWAEEVPKVMANIDTPKVYLVDLRPVWAGHYSQYTSDGIHCTSAGGTATAEAFWKVMKADNYEFFTLEPSSVAPKSIATATRSPFLGQNVRNGHVTLSLSLSQPSNVTVKLTNLTGRSVFSAQRQVAVAGEQTIDFPINGVAPGAYIFKVQAGKIAKQSTLLVP